MGHGGNHQCGQQGQGSFEGHCLSPVNNELKAGRMRRVEGGATGSSRMAPGSPINNSASAWSCFRDDEWLIYCLTLFLFPYAMLCLILNMSAGSLYRGLPCEGPISAAST